MSSDEVPPQVTREQIADALRELGLAPGDSVFVHSSLSRFGPVEGGAEAVCLAIIDAVGPEGTVLMPAFAFDYVKAENPVLDLERDPSCVGLIPETFRTRFATHRSRHITHSVAAAGARAEWFTSGHTRDAFCRESPFGRLLEAGGYVLLLGVDYNVCTFMHAIELALPVPYMGMTPKPDARIRLPGGEVIPADCNVHLPTEDYDFNRQGALLDAEGVVRMTPCGNSLLRLLPAAEVFERVLAELRRDPYALTRAGEEKEKVPVSAG
jgi:aminoglycoside 3-N-acetyltransferase